MYEVCVIPENGAPALVLKTVYETSFPTDSHVMVAVVNVLGLCTCTKFEGVGGPVECLKRSIISIIWLYNYVGSSSTYNMYNYPCSPACTCMYVLLL